MSFLSALGAGSTAALGGVAAAVVVVGVVGYVFVLPMFDEPPPAVPAEPAVQVAPEAAAPAAPETTADTETAAPLVPVFDVVRIDAQGGAVVAGTALAGVTVDVLLDGDKLAEAMAGGDGKFVSIFDIAPSDRPRSLSLVYVAADGTPVASDETILVAPFDLPAPQVADAGDTAPEEDAETPAAPALVVASRDGVEVLQPAPAPEAPATATLPTRSNVTIDTIAYDASAEVELTGRAGAGDFVRVYLDNGLQAEVAVSPEGRWRARLTDVVPGIYTLRVDEVSGDGAVTSRFETPFKREDPALLAARGAVTPAPEAAPVAEATPDTPAPDAAPDSGTVEVAAAEPQPEVPQPTATATPAPTPAVEAPPAEAPAPEPVETAAADPVRVDTTPASDPAPEAAPAAAETPVPDTATPAAVPEVAAADAPAPAAEPVASAEVAPAPVPRPAAQVITVQPGFTLWGIAQDMMGQGEMYVQVYEANKDQIRDPDLIYPGQVFTLPGQN